MTTKTDTTLGNVIRAIFPARGAALQRQKFSRVFDNPQHGDVLNLKVERMHDYWMITSKDLPGLFLCMKELGDVLDQVRPAIEALWEVMRHPEKYNANA